MAEETFEGFVARERERLSREREAIYTQQQQLENQLAAINREFSAIDAYEAAKSGKAIPIRGTRPGPRAGAAAPRVRSGSKREQLLAIIRQHPEGLARKNILEQMGLKGDKSGEMSVSNALTALTKGGQVVREEGRYRVG